MKSRKENYEYIKLMVQDNYQIDEDLKTKIIDEINKYGYCQFYPYAIMCLYAVSSVNNCLSVLDSEQEEQDYIEYLESFMENEVEKFKNKKQEI